MMEFEEEEEEEEEEEMDVTPTFKGTGDKKAGMAARYRECLKNHAVGIGGHAVDGCGEFMPAGPDGSLDALKCAACNCHRNFHRKELLPPDPHNNQLTLYSPRPHTIHHFQHHPQAQPQPQPPQVYNFYPYTRTTPVPAGYLHVSTPQNQQRPLALPSPTAPGGVEQERGGGMMMETGMGMGATTTTTSSSGKKRFRTKFTQEQKDKMLGLAERLGWRIQKQDEEVVQQFCQETGVKRHVLKVWMHNNKHTLGKKP